MDRWAWIFRDVGAALFGLLLATVLGASQLFQHARLGTNGVSASDIVRFVGYGAALLLIWLTADRAAHELPEDNEWRTLLRHMLVPLATLFVLAWSYPVPLLLLHPVMNDSAMTVYRWIFVLAISGAALWLTVAVYAHADVLGRVFNDIRRAARRTSSEHHPTTATIPARSSAACPHCGRELPAEASASEHGRRPRAA